MVSLKEYRSKPESFWIGKKVRLTRAIQNRNERYAEGRICEIRRKFGGFHLISEKCEACGSQVFITRVGPDCVELVE